MSLFRASGRLGEQPSFLRRCSEHVWKHVCCSAGSSVLELKCETLCARVCLVCLGENRLPCPPLPGLKFLLSPLILLLRDCPPHFWRGRGTVCRCGLWEVFSPHHAHEYPLCAAARRAAPDIRDAMREPLMNRVAPPSCPWTECTERSVESIKHDVSCRVAAGHADAKRFARGCQPSGHSGQ